MFKIIPVIILLSLLLSINIPSHADTQAKIGHLFNKKDIIKVYVEPIENRTGRSDIFSDSFRSALGKAFAQRRSFSFKIVPTAAESDIKISGAINKFQYLKKGPLKITPSATAIIADGMATMTENYVEMTARLTITDSKSGKVLWSVDEYDFIKRKMSEKESIPLIFNKIARGFVATSFGKTAGGTQIEPNRR